MKTSTYKSILRGQTNCLLPTGKRIVYDSFHSKIAAKNNKISQKEMPIEYLVGILSN